MAPPRPRGHHDDLGAKIQPATGHGPGRLPPVKPAQVLCACLDDVRDRNGLLDLLPGRLSIRQQCGPDVGVVTDQHRVVAAQPAHRGRDRGGTWWQPRCQRAEVHGASHAQAGTPARRATTGSPPRAGRTGSWPARQTARPARWCPGRTPAPHAAGRRPTASDADAARCRSDPSPRGRRTPSAARAGLARWRRSADCPQGERRTSRRRLELPGR